MESPEKNHNLSGALLFLCMFFSGYCGIVSELSLFNLGTVLLGGANTTLLYTMGVQMFFMGLGSILTESRLFSRISFDQFALIELLLSFFCMISIPFIHFFSSSFPYRELILFITLSAIIGTLIGMEIPIILRLNAQIGFHLRENSARVMMADYFGSLAAFVFFPYLLFPFLGITVSAFSGGVVNLLIALFSLFFFYPKFQRPGLIFILSFILLLFSVLLGVNLQKITDAADQKLYQDPVIYKRNTRYQQLVFTKRDPFSEQKTRLQKIPEKTIFSAREGRYELKKFYDIYKDDFRFFINGGLQFSSIDEYRYHEFLVHPAMALNPQAETVLVLGGGDGLCVREILKYEHVRQIILVDLDNELTDLFRHTELARLNNYALQNPRVQIINTDAFLFLRETTTKFPLILIDFPDPYGIETAKLYSRQFYELLRQALTEDGFYAVQSTSPLFNRRSFISIGKTLRSANLSALPAHIDMKSFEEWGFHLGSPTFDETQIREKLRNWTEPVETVYLNNNALQAAFLFGKDTFHDADSIAINDLNRLILQSLYKSGN